VPVAAIVSAWLIRRRQPLLSLGLLVVLIGILPVSGLIPFKGQNFSTVADRYFYLSMSGVALIAAWAAMRWRHRLAFWPSVAVLFATFAGITLDRQPVWASDIALWGDAARRYPNQVRVHNNYGVALQRAGRQDEAVEQFNLALRAGPDFADAYSNRGISFVLKGQPDRGLADQSHAIRLDPAYGGYRYNRAVTYFRLEQFEQALADATEAARLGANVPPGFVEAIRRRQAEGR
jgi:tetratricopeptide (TPR) repeat protein